MARIRTIKPEFYRHELLQELEQSHRDLRPMLVFSALWGHCDKQGIFEWRPKQLALDILPFVWKGSIGEALGLALELLRENKLIIPMEYKGKTYGYIPTFGEHQRISGKEAKDDAKYPQLCEMTEGKHWGSTGEALGKHQGQQEGKGRERKGKEDSSELSSETSEPPVVEIILNTKEFHPISQQDVDDWRDLFPAVDVLQELRKMAAWAKANPQRRKTDRGIRKFVVNWLSKEQDKGRKVPAVEQATEDIFKADLPEWVK